MSTYLRGVEMPLPEGERVLWQGNPSRNALALHAFHARKIAIYFWVLIVLTAFFSQGEPQPMKFFTTSALWLAIGGAMATAFALTVSMLSSRTSLYAITERRVVMKIGIALPVVLNIPLNIIDGVGVKKRTDGSGDLSLKLANKSRVAYAVLWPHARAWHVRYPEPLLRGIANVDAVGDLLRQALLGEVAAESSIDAAANIGIRSTAGVPSSLTEPKQKKPAFATL